METQMENQVEKKPRLWLAVIIIGLIVVGILAAIWCSLSFDIITSSRFPFRPLPVSFCLSSNWTMHYHTIQT